MSSENKRSARRHDIDWLRIFAVTMLIMIHTAAIFDRYPITAVKGRTSFPLVIFATFLHEWRLAILFIVSGAGSYFALGFLNKWRYLSARVRRIVIPLIAGTFLIVPIHLYYWQFFGNPGYPKSYPEFYKTIVVGFFAHGLFGHIKESLHWAHLWFLAYLFTASVVALPLFIYLKGEKGRELIDKLAMLMSKRGMIFLFAIPLVLVEVSLRPKFLARRLVLIDDWANFSAYLLLFIFGFIIFSEPRLIKAIERHRKMALVLGICTSLTYLLMVFSGRVPTRGYNPAYMLFSAMRGLNVWFWCVTIFGFAAAYLNHNHKILPRANEAVYPVYIIHLPIATAIAYRVVRLNIPPLLQFAFIVILTLIAALLIYEFIIRRTQVTRFLFGLKTGKTNQARPLPAVAAAPQTSTEVSEIDHSEGEPTPHVITISQARTE